MVEINFAKFWLVEECSNLRLLDRWGSFFCDHLNSLSHGLDTLWVHEVVVDGVHSVIDINIALSGEKQVTSVKAIVRVEN